MCFSAPVSFAGSVVLITVGVQCIRKTREVDSGYGLIGALPLLFGVQQAAEGFQWLALGGNDVIDSQLVALVYLFFAYFLWPFYIPLAALRLEHNLCLRRSFIVLAVLGLLFGAILYIPLLFNEKWLQIQLIRGSIVYEPILLIDSVAPGISLRAVYVLLIILPLVLSTVQAVRIFGLGVLASVTVSAFAFQYAFVSVWCFFAALLSVHIFYLLRGVLDRQRNLKSKHQGNRVKIGSGGH